MVWKNFKFFLFQLTCCSYCFISNKNISTANVDKEIFKHSTTNEKSVYQTDLAHDLLLDLIKTKELSLNHKLIVVPEALDNKALKDLLKSRTQPTEQNDIDINTSSKLIDSNTKKISDFFNF